MTEKQEIQKCVHLACNQDATWKGTATKEDIDKIDNRDKKQISVQSWNWFLLRQT